MKENKMNPRVYVGTYAKYNNGSIKGGWLSLNDYDTYADFCKACYALHKDERDPELMIQDTECMPDGLDCSGEWLSKQDFEDIKAAVNEDAEGVRLKFRIVDYSDKAIAVVGDTREVRDELKRLGGRFNARLSCGCGWIFSKAKLPEVEALVNGGAAPMERVEPKKKVSAELMAEIEAEYRKVWGNDERMVKFCVGEVSGAVRLSNGGIAYVEKQKLDTSFCFGYSTCGQGAEYDEASKACHHASTSEDYFREQNTADLQRMIDMLNGKDDSYGYHLYLQQKSSCSCGPINMYELVLLRHWDYEDHKEEYRYSELNDEDRKVLIALYEDELAKMNKRITSYLKRYGLSKVRTWTYWVDE